MKIKCIWEHNGNDTLLYSGSQPGAFARGASKEAALKKMPSEIISFLRWLGDSIPDTIDVVIVQEKASELNICDADSDIIFESEKTTAELKINPADGIKINK